MSQHSITSAEAVNYATSVMRAEGAAAHVCGVMRAAQPDERVVLFVLAGNPSPKRLRVWQDAEGPNLCVA